jgi:hypothetical protein
MDYRLDGLFPSRPAAEEEEASEFPFEPFYRQDLAEYEASDQRGREKEP